MDEKRLSEIRERAEKARPGPWTNNYNGWNTQTVVVEDEAAFQAVKLRRGTELQCLSDTI